MAETPKCLPPFKSFGTEAIHAGQPADPRTGAVMVPISLATTFKQPSPGVNMGYEYQRTGNPTRDAFEQNIAAVENGKYGIAFSSGLGATTAIINCLRSGDHVVVVDDVYGGTQRYFRRIAAPGSNLSFSFVDLSLDPKLLETAVNEKTKLVWIETPTNPTLKLVDIKAICTLAHARNLAVVVDNTFMSPYFQRPLDLGADLVLHSCSKYIGGHSDVIMGVIVTSNEDWKVRIKFVQNGMGAVPSPFDCYMAMRGMKTLHVRMERHQHNAFAISHYLSSHPKVEKVIYPGLESHPHHALACTQMTGFGGMIVMYIKGGLQASRKFLESLQLFILAESLGGVESLIEHPAIMTHASVPADQRALLGISDNMIRVSVGIEDVDDLIADLQQALEKV